MRCRSHTPGASSTRARRSPGVTVSSRCGPSSSTALSTEAPAARWAAVVVNYEAGPLLLSCVRSLMDDESAGVPEVVVIDNGSTDGPASPVHRLFHTIDGDDASQQLCD